MGARWSSSLLLLAIVSSQLHGQQDWVVRAYGGIGIGAASMASLADYATVLGGSSGERVEDFQSLFDVNGGLEIHVAEGWSLGIDYVSATRSIETNPTQPGIGWTFEPVLQMPTLMVRRLYSSSTMTYGFGGGLGYYAGRLDVRPPGLLTADEYSGSGLGVMFEALAFTYFDPSLAGMVAVDVRWASISNLKDKNGLEPRTGNGIVATLETYSISLRFGISYQL